MSEESIFEEYEGFSVEFRETPTEKHFYWMLDNDARERVPGVTTITNCLDKGEGLKRWYGKEDATATLECERAGELVGIPSDQAIYVVRQKELGANAKKEKGANRGKAVHSAMEAYFATGAVPALGDYHESVRGYVQGVCAWLIDKNPEPIHTEKIVGSLKHRYAGRFDLIAYIDGELTLVDLKTSPKVYTEHHLQMAGYLLAMEECGIEPPTKSLILAASESGHYTTQEGLAQGSQFLSVLSAHRAVKQVEKACRTAEKVA